MRSCWVDWRNVIISVRDRRAVRPTWVRPLPSLLVTITDCDCCAVEYDSFLPPATERHHQILLAALQLVVGTVVTFGADTTVASCQVSQSPCYRNKADAIRQALAFVAGQRETLLIALKECAAVQTLASLKEAHLIVTLLGIVLPSVSAEDLVSRFSFPVHSALT